MTWVEALVILVYLIVGVPVAVVVTMRVPKQMYDQKETDNGPVWEIDNMAVMGVILFWPAAVIAGICIWIGNLAGRFVVAWAKRLSDRQTPE